MSTAGPASSEVRVDLRPLGVRLVLPRGTPLQDVLFEHGVELPCGGRGACGGCKVRVLAGELALDDEQRALLSPAELGAGWRLACRCRAEADVTLELTQWQTPVLADHSAFAFTPREGKGIAVDVGTTTLVAQLLDLSTGHVLAVRTALNGQARYGADIMSRIAAALEPEGVELTRLIRRQVGALVQQVMDEAGVATQALRKVVLVGNTAMHHLFGGLDVTPLAASPFESTQAGLARLDPRELGWGLEAGTEIVFLPCLGGFVGSDVLAGILATQLHFSRDLVGLVDLGTNGEIVVGTSKRLLCASSAAGPAFEGARISAGMRAGRGAISAVACADGDLRCHVIGGGVPCGVCGSGLVDAVAVALDLGRIEPSGRLAADARTLPLSAPVELTQRDLREVQLAKGAIAAGLKMLLARLGAHPADLVRLYLAGAFGNYVNRSSARRIGLIDVPLDRIEPAGNTALLGAKLALFDEDRDYASLRARVEHVALSSDPAFEDAFADELPFPAA